MMSDVGTIRLILQALKRHKVEARVVKNACMALATIVESDGKFTIQLCNIGKTLFQYLSFLDIVV